MNIWTATGTHHPTRSSTWLSVAGHALLLVLVLVSPNLLPSPSSQAEVRLVRLAGGGEQRPGWVDPTPAPPDRSPAPDDRPLPVPEPKLETPLEQPEGSQLLEEKKDVVPPPPEPEAETEETPEEDLPAAEKSERPGENPDSTAREKPAAPEQDPPAETGSGVGRKAGPEGQGVGATTDTDFAGANAYLSRIEAEVQRRFNYRGAAAGKVAEYRFTIDRSGDIHDLVLARSSGVPSLDLSARSALQRAKLPPLPRTFPHDRLGVTYKFYGD